MAPVEAEPILYSPARAFFRGGSPNGHNRSLDRVFSNVKTPPYTKKHLARNPENLATMKRIVLFLMTNFAVLLVLSATMNVLGVGRYLTENGLDLTQLLIFAAVIGFTGSIISLLISKPMAKASTGARVIDPQAPGSAREAWLLDTVHQLADRAGIGRPEVAVYDGAPNAFATGAFKNNALVAVSTGLLQSMSEEEVAAVLGHEVAHVANGDMVTLTLIQGVVNTFVIFLSRVVGYFVDRVLLKNERETGIGFYVTAFIFEIIFGVLASILVAWFSCQI